MQEVALILAVYRPPAALLKAQVASVQAQRGVGLRPLAVIDGPEAASAEDEALLTQAGFRLLRNETRMGARASFLAGLAAALAESSGSDALFSFCDQDDRWQPEKLMRSAALLHEEDAGLVHCDARVVTAAGQVVAASLHAHERREEGRGLADHLIANTVTGMTAIFTRETAERLLALAPISPTAVLHDHLAALAAASGKGVRFLPAPLCDYVQHTDNLVGAVAPPGPSISWLGRPAAFRARSRALYAERQAMARAVAGLALADRDVRRLAGGSAVPVLARLALSYAGRRQWRRLRLSLRLLDAALTAPRAPDAAGNRRR